MRIAGFRVSMDPLLPVVLFLLTWLLAERYYPQIIYSPDPSVYWWMGGISALILVISIFIHELSHAATARFLNLELGRIHMFLFGGMAELKQRPIRPTSELIIAVAGPLASLALSLVGYLVMVQIEPFHDHIHLLAQFTFMMNMLLALFNLLPIYPLDGGRALRALIWSWQKRFHHASIITFQSSSVFIALLFLGSGVSVFLFGMNIALWTGFLALYLGYTAFTGRQELISKPRYSDLIFKINGDHTPVRIIEELQALGTGYIGKAIIPRIEGQKLKGVIYGADLHFPGMISDLMPFQRTTDFGDYIEINNYNTYHPGIEYNAEYVPVFQNEVFLGLCDADEMRFWLLERKTI